MGTGPHGVYSYTTGRGQFSRVLWGIDAVCAEGFALLNYGYSEYRVECKSVPS